MRQLQKYLFDNSEDVQDRLFILLSLIALAGLLAAGIYGLFTGESTESMLITFSAFGVFSFMVYRSFTRKRIRLVANIVAFLLVFVFFPLIYFTSGGIYSGTPLWFVFSIIYIAMILNGKTRIFFFVSQLIISAVCYYLQYNYRRLVIPHSVLEFYTDSLGSLIIVSIMITLLVSFQTFMYRRENEITRAQKDEIDELNKSQNTFFSSMSHEIRTPINTIIGLNEMILREEISDEVAEDAENIQGASRMLLSLINDILDMSKLQSGQMQLTIAPYNTPAMIMDVITMMRIRAKEKGLEFNVTITSDIPTGLSGDEVRIKQILINIINNAIKYTREGYVNFTVQCEKKDYKNMVMIYSVEDSGIGIKKENIPYLFTAFKRVDEKENRYIEGTGLGLSIVKQLVDLMGGKISVNSVYTQGSTFVVEIPQEIVDATPVDMTEDEKKDSRISYHRSFHAPDARVLVVDDTTSNLMVVKKLLRDTDIRIDTAGSGAEALKLTLETDYHVILMDHLMPEMDGIECMHRIREQTGGLSREARIVALTANAESENRSLYAREGFDGYVVKPVSGAVLEAELLRQLPRNLVTVEAGDEEVLKASTSWISKSYKKINICVLVPSVADVPEEYLKKYGIGIIPLEIETEGGLFRDGVDIDASSLVSYMVGKGKNVKLKPIEREALEAAFAGYLKYANNIIYLTATKKAPDNSYHTAIEAAKSFDNVSVFDTGHLSTAIGILAVEASRMAEKGMPVPEILEHLEKEKHRVHTSFVVQDMENLSMSGQMNPKLAGPVRAFMIRPVLVIKNGKIRVKRIYLGPRQIVRRRYIASVLRHRSRLDKRILFITHVGLSVKELEEIKAEVLKRVKFENVVFQQASPAISVNVGIGAFGLIFHTTD